MPVFRREMQKPAQMRSFFRFVAVIATAVSAAVPAGAADDLGAVTASVASAAEAVQSFVVKTEVVGTTGVRGTITFVRPKRMKFAYSIGQMSIETYLVDGVVYIHAPQAGWRKMTLDSLQEQQQSVNIGDTIKSAKVTLLPDRQENGATMGAMQVETTLPTAAGPIAQSAGAQPLVCTYDKATYRISVCANNVVTMTYSNYNDPANIVVLPPEAKSATVMELPAPAPSALAPVSPEPAPSPSI